VLLISGGSSVGVKDNTEKIISSLPQTELLVHGLAIKPGKPTLLGVSASNKVVFGLPGHPLSAYFIFRIFVTAAIARLEGAKCPKQVLRQAVLSVNYPSNGGREEYVPVSLSEKDGKALARPVFSKSGLISLLSLADGYIRIPRDKEGIMRGETVEVTLF
jgi:molybdopterin molybdotransferase